MGSAESGEGEGGELLLPLTRPPLTALFAGVTKDAMAAVAARLRDASTVVDNAAIWADLLRKGKITSPKRSPLLPLLLRTPFSVTSAHKWLN